MTLGCASFIPRHRLPQDHHSVLRQARSATGLQHVLTREELSRRRSSQSAATLPLPPPASAIAVPPSAVMSIVVELETSPPSTHTGPAVSPTEMTLPTLPPLSTLPITAAPPLALAVALPPLPAAVESSAATAPVHEPDEQSPLWHTLPQAPQLSGSCDRSVHSRPPEQLA